MHEPRPDAPDVLVVGWPEALRTWCRIAVLSFGGPAGQIAVMHRILVEEKKWLSEARFLHALNYCMLLPGPEAQQLATYTGWLLHRTLGGVVAGTLFVVPGFCAILVLSILYAYYQQTDFLQAVFFGLKPAVLAIVIEAVLRIGKRVLKNGVMVSVAATAFVGIFFFGIPFPLLILAAGLFGFLAGRFLPERLAVLKGHGAGAAEDEPERVFLHSIAPSWQRTVVVCVVFSTLWFGPLVLLSALFGRDSVFVQEGVFFSKAAVVTFGGAYSVLAYVAQQAVENFGWLKAGEMLDGLGMAETTPGPLIQVVQFVGFMGAFRDSGALSPLAAGILGSVVTAWVTFVPCFFWIFLGAPYIERLRSNRLLTSALSAITAAVVGVVLNLAIWFGVHTLFGDVQERTLYSLHLLVPDWSTIDWGACAVAAIAMLMTFKWKRGMATTLLTCSLLGIALYYVLAHA